jgi:hypothetical protein
MMLRGGLPDDLADHLSIIREDVSLLQPRVSSSWALSPTSRLSRGLCYGNLAVAICATAFRQLRSSAVSC